MLIVGLGGTGKLDQTELHNHVVYQLLCFCSSVRTPLLQVSLGIDIQEGGGAAQAHGGAILRS